MARECIPYSDAAFLAWMNNSSRCCVRTLATFGLTAADRTPQHTPRAE